MEEEIKKDSFQKWRTGTVKVMVATKAFGMGIDYQAVRFVLHKDLPDSILDYAQESGRCGRDGKLAMAVLLFKEKAGTPDENDILGDDHHHDSVQGDDTELQRSRQEMVDWARNERVCRRLLLQLAVDGPNLGGTRCAFTPGCSRCDVCEVESGPGSGSGSGSITEVGVAVLVQAEVVEGRAMLCAWRPGRPQAQFV